MTIVPATGDAFTTAWTLTALSNSLADVGSWTVTLRVTLQNYVSVAAATKVINPGTVIDPCLSTII